MADLRIVDAPLLSTVKGTEKIPTGGEGNFSISMNQVADFAKLKWVLATEGYVDNAVGNAQADLNLHKNNESNPHNVTKTQVGLSNVDNTADLDKPLSNATQSAIITANSGKADKSYVDSQDQLKADKNTVEASFLLKADKVDLTASKIASDGNQNQQEINDFGGAKWYAKVGGYKLGATVKLDNGNTVQSTIPNNTNDPNVNMTGWVNKLGDIQATIDKLNRISANSYGASTSATYQVNRAAIQAANDAAFAAGGGVVTLEAGEYIAKGIVQDSGVIFDFKGVTIKSPDGLAPNIIETRTINCQCSITKASNQVTITSGVYSGIKVGSRVGIIAAGGILDSQVSTLTTTIDATSKSIVLANATGLTALAPLLIGDELISFTGVSGNTLVGVTRGVSGTTAVAHTTAEPIGVARRLTATVIAVNGSVITLDKPSLKTATGVQLTYGTINSGIVGFPTIDGNKPIGGAPSSVYGLLVQTASRGVYDLSFKNTDVGGVMFSNGSAYNYGHRIYLHDCGVPDGGRGSGFWLYQGADNNHFNHIEVTGESWVGVYLDDRTSSSDPWNAPNNNNTFVTVNIDVTKSTTAPLNIVSGQYNRFLGGSIKAPRVGLSLSDNGQGTGGGAKSIGNHFDNFTISVDEYPYLVYSVGNTLSNISVLKGRLAPLLAAGNTTYAISPALGAPPIMPKGYRKNSMTLTKLLTWDGWDILNGTGSENGAIAISDTAVAFNPLAYNTALVPASAGETWAAAMDVTVPVGSPTMTLRLAIISYKSDGIGGLTLLSSITSANYTIAAGQTVRISSFMPATPVGTEGLRVQIQNMTAPSSGRKIVVKPLVTVEKDTIAVQSLFDGDTEGAMWTGEVGASPSLLF